MLTAMTIFGFAGISLQELLLVFLIVLLVFGAAKIPDIARSLGKAIREFKKGAKDEPDQPEPPKPADTKDSQDKPQDKP